MIFKYTISKDDVLKYNSINDLLVKKLNFSTRLKSKVIDLKKVLYNNTFINTNSKLYANDILSIDFSYTEDNSNIISTKMNLDIVYEDEWLIVLNKPAGIPIHPSRNNINNSFSNGIKAYFDEIKLNKKLRPVNRLDIDTSGLTIFAKCEYIQECLSKQMNLNIFEKYYLCLVLGIPRTTTGIINLPIGRNEDSIIERCIRPDGKPSITCYEVIKSNTALNISLVKCKLKTGRTHQIRVHMKSINHPLLGDSLYNTTSDLISRQALHCCHLKFIHPITNTTIELFSNSPSDMDLI